MSAVVRVMSVDSSGGESWSVTPFGLFAFLALPITAFLFLGAGFSLVVSFRESLVVGGVGAVSVSVLWWWVVRDS